MQKKVTWKTWLGAFVPQYIPNRIVCGVMGLLSILHKTSKKKREENRANNLRKLGVEVNTDLATGAENRFKPGEYVENQPQWKDIYFGKRSNMAYSGCEILAVYNARVALGEGVSTQDLIELIGNFERSGAVWAGLLGTAPGAICKYFRKRGYDIQIEFRREEGVIDEAGANSDTAIVTFYNDAHNIFKMIHTVNISKDAAGKYWIHNCYKRRGTEFGADGPYESLWNAIHNRGSGEKAVLCVIGIRKNAYIGGENREL